MRTASAAPPLVLALAFLAWGQNVSSNLIRVPEGNMPVGKSQPPFRSDSTWEPRKTGANPLSYAKSGEALIRLRKEAVGKEGEKRLRETKGYRTRKVAGATYLLRPEAGSGQPSQAWRRDPAVAWVEPNLGFQALGGPDRETLQRERAGAWRDASEFAHLPWHTRNLKVPPKASSKRRTRVGILDSGIDYLHPDLQGSFGKGVNLTYEKPALPVPGEEASDSTEMDYHGHGTQVAGIIAAGHNAIGVDGLDGSAEVFAIKAFDRSGTGTLADILAGIQWAIENRMDILVMAFGSYEHSRLLEEKIDEAAAAGMILVASAGNDHAPEATYPAKFEKVVAVGSHDQEFRMSRFSNHGAAVDIFAPGHQVPTTGLSTVNSSYVPFTGTSASAAYIAGIYSLCLSRSLGAAEAGKLVLDNPILRHPWDDPEGAPYREFNPAALNMAFEGQKVPELTLTGLSVRQRVYRNRQPVAVRYHIQNTGSRPSGAADLEVEVSGGSAFRMGLGKIPPLQPGAVHSDSVTLHLSPEGEDFKESIIALQLGKGELKGAEHARPRILQADQDQDLLHVIGFWAEAPDLNYAQEKVMSVTVCNRGNTRLADVHVRPGFQNARHCGLHKQAATPIGPEVLLAPLEPGERREIRLAIPDFRIPASGYLTFDVPFTKGGAPLSHLLQEYQRVGPGEFKLQYAQNVHREQAKAAVELLRKQGIWIKDLEDGPFLGEGSLPLAGDWNTPLTGYAFWVPSPGWWTDNLSYWSRTDATFVNGAHDCDAIDLAFLYTKEDTFDSHFWMVDYALDDGLNSSGVNHHSAYTKIRALLFGTAGASDSKVLNGALDHYRNGYKKAAWYLLGHATHLLQDVTLPSHVNDDNWHGVTGSAYHDWMDTHYSYVGNASRALSQGGMIDPYQFSDPTGFLSYVSAQVGNSFAWTATDFAKATALNRSSGAAGNRNGSTYALANRSAYDSWLTAGPWSFMQSNNLRLGLPAKHPLAWRDLAYYEVRDFCAADDFCPCCTRCEGVHVLDILGSEESRDCWDGGDGHIDVPNNGSNMYSRDEDHDLSAIGESNYNFGLRAVAGLLYYFAKETGQLNHQVLPAVNHILL